MVTLDTLAASHDAAGVSTAVAPRAAIRDGRSFRLRRRLGVGIAALVALALAATAALVVVAARSRAATVRIDADEARARQARALGVDAREQYIHEAHSIILADRSHVAHQSAWVARFEAKARDLAGDTPPADRARLDAIVARSRALQDVFEREILPAIDRNDRPGVLAAHERAVVLVEDMTARADGLAALFEARTHQTTSDAARDARIAVAFAALVAALAAVTALFVARRIWSGVAAPLARLQRAADQVTAGETDARVGALRAIELDVVGAAFDQMLDRLARRESELVEAERLAVLGRLVAGVAHEINNPIGVIRGYLKTMLAEVRDEGLRAELAILDEEAFACQRIVEDMLVYARAPTITAEATSIRELVTDTVERLRTAGELGACRVDIDVRAGSLDVDPVRLRQVVANLVRNAAQAMPAGGPIDLSGRATSSRYELTVADRGEGIAPAIRRQLFEPFVTTRSAGTGLGLAVCAAIVRAHGGEIEVRERSGGGSLFVVRLPRGEPATTATEHA